MKIYIIRSDYHWDNPTIRFATTDENLAKTIVDLKEREYWEHHIHRMNIHMRDKYADDLKLVNMLRENNLPIPESVLEDEKYAKEHFEIYNKAVEETYDTYVAEQREGWPNWRGFDWFYEEIDLVDTLDEAEELTDGVN